MGIEPRRNGRRYLYRKERMPSGVRSVYLGPASDPACELLAECAEGRRREAAASRRAHARTFDPIDAALDGLRQSADDLRPLVRAVPGGDGPPHAPGPMAEGSLPPPRRRRSPSAHLPP